MKFPAAKPKANRFAFCYFYYNRFTWFFLLLLYDKIILFYAFLPEKPPFFS